MGRFEGFRPETLEFFMALGMNNSKPFFEAHRSDYETYVLKPLKDLAFDLAPTMLEIDGQFDARPVIGGALSRIYRDARRVRGGAPYRNYMWLSYRRKQEGNRLGFYYDITESSSSLGMGIFEADAAYMKRLWTYIAENGARYKALLKKVKKAGFALHGHTYKRPPMQSDDREINDILKRRTFHFNIDIPIPLTFTPQLPEELCALFLALKELYKFFRMQS